ncbi:MAG TPA: c-type cytochrome [Rhodocyclaceae bacterium]|nr:c-type cytochrome [Rhodocyclaceae bacterium]HMZ00131.1 c-type cytochrome [Burkholderiaceae bacterium]HNB47353.1 c-type cytochrome [Burkholderiaceae bacterium]HNG82161.1 c-type cytochrome [Burkholderiaceae bacterium]
MTFGWNAPDSLEVVARRPALGLRSGWLGLALVLGLGGCAVQWQNARAAQEVAKKSEPPGSVYAGWRVFQDRCAACHGADAAGSAAAPDLRARVRELGERRFVSLVLTRYDWNQAEAIESGPARGSPAQVDEVLQRRKGALVMPAWEGEPRVTAHIGDLYAYLAARAEGTQGPGRPQR